MPRKIDLVDRRPGAAPHIRLEGEHVVFELPVVADPKAEARLVIRCDANGDAWVSIGYRRPAPPQK
jgi:hypothetical protein